MPAAKAKPTVDPQRRRLSLGHCSAPTAARRTPSQAPPESQLLDSLRGDILSHLPRSDNAVLLRTKTDVQLNMKRTFEEKDSVAEGGAVADIGAALRQAGIGFTCRKGLKAESPNQDSYCVCVQSDAFKVFAVFDGHGPHGHDVSCFAAENLMKLFLRHKDRESAPEEALRCAFVDCQRLLDMLSRQGKINAAESGSTGTVAYLPSGEGALYVAHVGDSRGVLCRRAPDADDGTKGGVAMDLTVDHKPELQAERERIEKAGGLVVFDGYYNYRVYLKDGRGGLNMSRALGDSIAQQAGVSAVPEAARVPIDVSKVEYEAGKDLFLMLCSDGVWEFLSSQAACDVVIKHGREQPQKAVEELAKRSFDLWIADSEGEVSDDITAVLVWL